MNPERRRPSRPSRTTARVSPGAPAAAAAPITPAPGAAAPLPAPARDVTGGLERARLHLVRVWKALDAATMAIWFRLMVWLVALQGAVAGAVRRGARAARARRGVPVHVFLAARNERIALERALRAALRGLARTNGPLPSALRLSVIAHHSPETAPPVTGRCLRLTPSEGGGSTVLIELALYHDGQRLSTTEVVSRLVSCYVALTAALPAPTPAEAPGAVAPAPTPNRTAARRPPATPARQRAAAPAPSAPSDAPGAGDPSGATTSTTPDDPAGILHLVTGRSSRQQAATPATQAIATPGPDRDPQGRWRKPGD